ncbi:DUF7673 family protein [Noviherbaspirillum aerium]|uniref:DUF7673 family protein n=1 Tax=Noviherbaspirillum aerium TaxID=2588497 RepID=UPI00124DBF94|nr:hypothetical protein [Noviherbaspirillum aerium]
MTYKEERNTALLSPQEIVDLMRREAENARIADQGITAFERLSTRVRSRSDQHRVVAALLMNLFDQRRFRFNVLSLALLDYATEEDCIALLRLIAMSGIPRFVREEFHRNRAFWEQLPQLHGLSPSSR